MSNLCTHYATHKLLSIRDTRLSTETRALPWYLFEANSGKIGHMQGTDEVLTLTRAFQRQQRPELHHSTMRSVFLERCTALTMLCDVPAVQLVRS